MTERVTPIVRGVFSRMCGVCYTMMVRDILHGKCLCVNDKCEQYGKEFNL